MTDKQSYNIAGKCTATFAEEKDCKFCEPGLTNNGKCLMRSIIENHCISYEAYKDHFANADNMMDCADMKG
jgi:hypothetical protein